MVHESTTDYSMIIAITFIISLTVSSLSILILLGMKLTEKRLRKLILSMLGLYYLNSLIISVVIMFIAETPPPNYGFAEGITGVFQLSLMGCLLFSILVLPPGLITVWLIERITRKRAAIRSSYTNAGE